MKTNCIMTGRHEMSKDVEASPDKIQTDFGTQEFAGGGYPTAETVQYIYHLDGAKTYKLRVPPNVPVKDVRSLVVYDPVTRSQLQTDQPYPSVNSQNEPVANADGSVDVYSGPKAPEGMENNWIQTVPGKGWFTIFRFHGPLGAYTNKTSKPNDIVHAVFRRHSPENTVFDETWAPPDVHKSDAH